MTLFPPAPPNKFYGAKTPKAHENSGPNGRFLKSYSTDGTDNPWISNSQQPKLLIVERNLFAGLYQISTGYPYISTCRTFSSTRRFCRFTFNFFLYFFENKKERLKKGGRKQENTDPRVRGAAYFLIHGLRAHPRVNPWKPVDRLYLRNQLLWPDIGHHPRVRGLFCLVLLVDVSA